MSIFGDQGLRLKAMSKEKSVILEYAKSAKPRSTNHKVLSQDDYLDGKVAKVEYSDGGQIITQWFIVTKRHKGYADTESQLIQQLANAGTQERSRIDWINQIFNISGLIALVLVCTSAYLTIHNQDGNIPEHLKASVLTILGFYFGGLVKGKGGQTTT